MVHVTIHRERPGIGVDIQAAKLIITVTDAWFTCMQGQASTGDDTELAVELAAYL